MKKEGVRVEYHQAEKLSWNDFVKTIPKEFVPGKITGASVAIIFLIVVILGIVLLPWGNFTNFSGVSENLEIKIGLPWVFFKVNLAEAGGMPLKFGGLFLDLLVYIIIGYMINVAWNAFSSSMGDMKEKKGITKEYKVVRKEN